MKDKGSIYIVATPIGNTGDISPRAVETLKKVDLILCEDTRHSGRLLKLLEIDTRLMSYHEHNEASRTQELMGLLEDGLDIALISDAGTPCISDPGQVLVDACHKRGIKIVSLPGPSAAIAAVSSSGFTSGRFQFFGFVPRKDGQRREILEETINYPGQSIFYESPARLIKTLKIMEELMADRRILIAREISKLNEEFFRGTVSQALDHFKDRVKGELVIVLDSYEVKKEIDLEKELKLRMEKGLSASKAAKEVAKEFDISKNHVYELSIKLTNE